MNARHLAAHAAASVVHAAASITAATLTYHHVHIHGVSDLIPALAVFVLVGIGLDQPIAWALNKLTAPTGPAHTGPEFAARHGNDSIHWTTADFETVQNLAAMDAQPAWTALHTKPTPNPGTELTPAA